MVIFQLFFLGVTRYTEATSFRVLITLKKTFRVFIDVNNTYHNSLGRMNKYHHQLVYFVLEAFAPTPPES